MRIVAVCLGALLLAPLAGQAARAAETPANVQADPPLATNREGEPELGAVYRSSQLTGRELLDQKQQPIGQVSDLLLDVQAGRMVALVVTVPSESVPSDSGIEHIAIPVELVKANGKTFTATVPSEKLKQASRFKRDGKSQPLTRAWALKNHRHFEQESLWKADAQMDQPLTLASSLHGLPISNPAGKRLGHVEDAALLLDNGLVGYLAVTMTGDKAAKGKLYPIPLSAFVVQATDGTWILELPPDVLAKTPTFDANHWPETVDRGWVEYVHVRYGRSPFAGVRAELHKDNR